MPARIPEQQYIDDLQRVARKVGGSPTIAEYRKHGEYGVSTATDKFGSWNGALTEANLDLNAAEISDQQYINDLHRVADKIGDTPSMADYREHGKYSDKTAQYKFGSWNEALIEADLELNAEPAVGVDKEAVFNDILSCTDSVLGPAEGTYISEGKFSKKVVFTRFNGWWSAVVRAGKRPRERRPLSPEQYRKFVQTAQDAPPTTATPVLLSSFTGLLPRLIGKLSQDWLADRRDRNIIRVPADYLDTDMPWAFRIPETWYDPTTGEERETRLPELLDWFWKHYDGEPACESTVTSKCLKIADKAGLGDSRTTSYYPQCYGTMPEVRADDLRITQGINLVRRNVDTDTIQRRLGITHTNWQVNIEELFVWNWVHQDNFSHPEFDPPSGGYIDPNTGEFVNS